MNKYPETCFEVFLKNQNEKKMVWQDCIAPQEKEAKEKLKYEEQQRSKSLQMLSKPSILETIAPLIVIIPILFGVLSKFASDLFA